MNFQNVVIFNQNDNIHLKLDNFKILDFERLHYDLCFYFSVREQQ